MYKQCCCRFVSHLFRYLPAKTRK